MKNKIWYLEPIQPENEDIGPWHPHHHKLFGIVVCCETEKQARAMADRECGDENRDKLTGKRLEHGVWFDPAMTTCVELNSETHIGVVCRSYASD